MPTTTNRNYSTPAIIILPDRNIPRTKFLLPVQAREWRAPSQRSGLFTIENQTRFRLTSRLHDGYVVWRGWFDDRNDADAFLFAMASGSLLYERQLWDLPSPAWRPGIGEELSYEFATVTFLTSPTGSNQTYNVPADWNSSSNTIEAIGAGGGGNRTTTASGGGGGGGGGQYCKITNLSLTPSGSATYRLGTGGQVVRQTVLTAQPVEIAGSTAPQARLQVCGQLAALAAPQEQAVRAALAERVRQRIAVARVALMPVVMSVQAVAALAVRMARALRAAAMMTAALVRRGAEVAATAAELRGPTHRPAVLRAVRAATIRRAAAAVRAATVRMVAPARPVAVAVAAVRALLAALAAPALNLTQCMGPAAAVVVAVIPRAQPARRAALGGLTVGVAVLGLTVRERPATAAQVGRGLL